MSLTTGCDGCDDESMNQIIIFGLILKAIKRGNTTATDLTLTEDIPVLTIVEPLLITRTGAGL